MPVPPSPELLEPLRRHELLTEQQLTELANCEVELGTKQQIAEELVRRRWLTHFQAEHYVTDQLTRLELGGYRLLEPIGAGGMGEVFLGRQKKLNRDVAIKLIRSDFAAAHVDALSRFRREALAVARLAHPNIVHIYDTDELDGNHFIVMEYVPGVDLARLVNERGPLPVVVACDYIRQAALGLQHAHEAGLVHRDVKPSNLLATIPEGGGSHSFGLVKILDLGLARLSEDTTDLALTRDRGVLGTPDFISPEQARDPHRADIRSDLYSLGCTFYFLLTGQVPFPNGTGIEKVMCHQLERPKSVSLLRPEVSGDVQNVLTRLMKKDPRERYRTPAELAQALTEVQARLTRPVTWPPRPAAEVEPNPAAPQPAPAMPSKAPSTEQVKVPGIPAPGLAGLVHGTCLSQLAPELQPKLKRSDIPRPAGPSVIPPMLPGLPSANAEAAAPGAAPTSLGKGSSGPSCRVVKAASIPEMVAPSTLLSQSAPRIAVLQGHTAQVVTMSFGPRGRFLATGGLDHAVRVWRLDGEETRQETAFLEPRLGEIRAMTFTPSGQELLLSASGLGGRVWFWRWRDTAAHNMVALDQAANAATGASAVAVSPNGKHIAAAVGRDVHVWYVSGSEISVVGSLTSRGNEITSLAFTSDGGILFAGDAVGRLLVWARRWRRYRPEATAAAHSGPINAMVVSADDRRLATAGTDNAVRVWGKFDAIENMFTVAGGLRGVVRRLQFTTDGRTLLAATDAAQVAGWRAHDGDMVCDWRLNQIMSTCQALADHGGLVALGRTDGMVNLYQIGKVPPPSSAGTASQGNDKLEKTSKRRR